MYRILDWSKANCVEREFVMKNLLMDRAARFLALYDRCESDQRWGECEGEETGEIIRWKEYQDCDRYRRSSHCAFEQRGEFGQPWKGLCSRGLLCSPV